MNFVRADAARLPFANGTFDLTFTSPPYIDARTYGIDAQRHCQGWIDWMLGVVTECVRVTKGLVLVNCAGVTRDWCYQPGPEGLLYEWWKRGGRCWRPAYWHRVGIPGSGGKQWLRADIEYVLAFTSCQAAIPWADNIANGHPPKWAPGGEMSHRTTDGERVNDDPWGKRGRGNNLGGRKPNGEKNLGTNYTGGKDAMGFHKYGGRGKDKDGVKKKTQLGRGMANGIPGSTKGGCAGRRVPAGTSLNGEILHDDVYVPPVLANPGVLVQGINVGGGVMGHKAAHENEAPFPEKLAEWFIRGWCPPGGRVLDPFSGSGTTVAAALSLGRVGVGCDIRLSQCQLGRRRCRDVQPPLFSE